jgi:hypothetical protein
MTVTISLPEYNVTKSGVVYLQKKPQKRSRIEFQNPQNEIFIMEDNRQVFHQLDGIILESQPEDIPQGTVSYITDPSDFIEQIQKFTNITIHTESNAYLLTGVPLFHDSEIEEMRFYLDRATGLLVRSVGIGPHGQVLGENRIYYTVVDGIKLYEEIVNEVLINDELPRASVRIRFTSILVNQPITPSVFIP